MRVKEIMTENPACCTPGTKLPEVARLMRQRDCGAIPVVDDERHREPVGVITDRDIVCRALAEGRDASAMTAGECMTTEVVTVGPEDDVEECERRMRARQIRRVLVTGADGTLQGIVAQADIARHRPEKDAAEVLQDVSA